MEKKQFEPNREIVLLTCNVDDMTGEEIGFAREILMEAGAMEFYTIPVQMKKGRPGFEIRTVCRKDKAGETAALLLKHTSTFGVRRQDMNAYALERTYSLVHTPGGDVRRVSADGYGVHKEKYEYDDVASYAKRAGISIQKAKEEIDSFKEQ